MFDNVHIKFTNDNAGGVNFIETTPQYLSSITGQGIGENGNHWVMGLLDSLKVIITDTTISIKDRSLCKFYLGDNLKTLSRGDTQRAIESISDRLHQPMDKSNVTRIDLAQNIVLKHAPELYYPYLGELKSYSRLIQPNSIYYTNNQRLLAFYNKEKEQTDKGQQVPELYKNSNPIRYELRFKTRLKQQFKVDELNASMLYDETFYRQLVKRWRDEYLHIQKIKSKLQNMEPTGSKKEFTDQAVKVLIGEVGQDTMLAMVKEWQGMGKINKKQAYELRNYIKAMVTATPKEQVNELINELTTKIKQVARV